MFSFHVALKSSFVGYLVRTLWADVSFQAEVHSIEMRFQASQLSKRLGALWAMKGFHSIMNSLFVLVEASFCPCLVIAPITFIVPDIVMNTFLVVPHYVLGRAFKIALVTVRAIRRTMNYFLVSSQIYCIFCPEATLVTRLIFSKFMNYCLMLGLISYTHRPVVTFVTVVLPSNFCFLVVGQISWMSCAIHTLVTRVPSTFFVNSSGMLFQVYRPAGQTLHRTGHRHALSTLHELSSCVESIVLLFLCWIHTDCKHGSWLLHEFLYCAVKDEHYEHGCIVEAPWYSLWCMHKAYIRCQ